MTRSRLFAAVLAAALLPALSACDISDAPAEEAHAHGGGGIVVTDFTETTELFV